MFLTALIVPEFETLRELARSLWNSFPRDADLIVMKEVRKLYDKKSSDLRGASGV